MERIIGTALAVLALAACGSGGDDDAASAATPTLHADELAPDITNALFPAEPGDRWEYRGETEEGTERVVVRVLDETRQVMGVDARVVRDTVYLDDEVVEDTWDWYAQDDAGNVWYLGEESYEYEDGERTSSDGSWEAGVDGAEPGVIMLASPKVGDRYRQEWYEGEAEDEAEVRSLDEEVSVPAGDHDEVLMTLEMNPLEDGSEEHKWYAPGVGLVRERSLESGEVLELVETNRSAG